MLLSRFWYLLLAAAGAVAVVAALSTQVAFNRQYERDLDDQLRRDRYELELNLKILARSQLDAIAPIAGKEEVRSALRRPVAQIDAAERARLQSTLTTLNRQLEEMQADLLFAVDRQGTIAAQIETPAPEGAGLGAFPLVAATLNGYVGDDVWVYNDKVYRMAAWPVVSNNEYVGAIVHGMELDSDFADRLSRQLVDANVAFFKRDRLIASHVAGRLTSQMVETALPHALEDEAMSTPAGTAPIALGTDGKAVFALVTGSAAHSQVGFVIARPQNRLGSPLDVFDQVADDDVETVSKQAMLVGGVALATFLLAMLFMYLERDRPLGKLKRSVLKAGKPDSPRIDVSSLGGQYRNIALGVNEALDRTALEAGESGARKKAANLDEILGPSPAASAPAPYFSFAEKKDESGANVPAVPPANKPMPPPPGRPSGPGGSGLVPATRESGAIPAAPPGPSPIASSPTPGPRPAPPAPGPMAAPRPSPGATSAYMPPKPPPPAVAEAKKDNGAAKPEPKAASSANGETSGVQNVMDLDDDENREESTMVAAIPEELLAQSGLMPAIRGNDEESHFKDVYEKFLATKKECGEPTAGLTLDKFKETLKKNRDQIVSKHGAKSVRFTVYVKDGKAALKATPVREEK